MYNKSPPVIADKIKLLWTGSSSEPPKWFLADNGGKFENKEYCDVAENFNIKLQTLHHSVCGRMGFVNINMQQ